MAKEKTISEYTDKNKYIYRWLTDGPGEATGIKSFEIDLDKRLDSILTALHKVESNVIRLKSRKK